MVSNKITFETHRTAKVKPYVLEKDKQLKEKINKASKAIRKKYLALKLGKAEEDESLNRLLKPVIDPIKELKSMNLSVKPTNCENVTSLLKTPVKHKEEEGEEDSTFEDIYEATSKIDTNEYFEQYPSLAKYYITGLYNKSKNLDKTYGVRLDLETNKFYVGSMELHVGPKAEINIGNKMYHGKQGLYELLFMKDPKGYDDQDLHDYKDILEASSAHRRNYDPLSQFSGTRSSKYTKVIKPLFKSQPRSGEGISMVYNEKPIEYVYWDDVNELVDRLRLLNASKGAGNTDSHDNEILAIINELREAGVIY